MDYNFIVELGHTDNYKQEHHNQFLQEWLQVFDLLQEQENYVELYIDSGIQWMV